MVEIYVSDADGGVEITYTLMKPMGIPVKEEKRKLGYEEISELPKIPENLVGLGENEKIEFYLPKTGKTIVVIIDKYCEKPSGPDEEDLYGPYLKE